MNRFLGCLACTLTLAVPAPAAVRVPVIIDTDIGSDIDDALALALVVASPELDLRAVTTCGGAADDRAGMVCRFLTQVGLKDIPVAAGKPGPVDYGLDWQIQYRRHPAAIFNRTLKPVKDSAVELLYQKLKADERKITIVCLGPLTNIAALLKEHPDAAPMIKRLVIMGGSIKVGYGGKKVSEPEWNFRSDVAAARAVLASSVPITLAPLDATAHLKLNKEQREHLFSAHTPLTWQVQNLYELWDKETPILFDPVAVMLTFEERFCTLRAIHLTVDDKGQCVPHKGGKDNVRVAVAIETDEFIKWYVDRVRSHGKETLPAAGKNVSKLIEQGGFSSKVHTFEDYDTDIEKRWWMCGKLETKDVPPGGSRCCRAVLTQDFDDRQGDMKTMYRAVIFNPVPGPPMGKSTRLSFRYKLKGTDSMRIALYSLSNGYHRYLTLNGLTQDEWKHGTVDMTQMRRPDGTGGSLAENERIDDIQFYIDPRAELLIDDIILFDAAAEGEKRPFPKRILFTGWFDTGKQGKEWPGEFEIVNHEKPRMWKYAKSVLDKVGNPWIRLSLRGDRRWDSKTELTFKYRLIGADSVSAELAFRRDGSKHSLIGNIEKLKRNDWSQTTTDYPTPAYRVGEDELINEIIFRVPKGAELHLDDVLLYVPGEAAKK